MPRLPRDKLPLPPKPFPQPDPAPWKPLGLQRFPQLKEPPVSLKPAKPSKAARNNRKQEARKLAHQPPQPAPARLEEIVFKRLG